MITADAPAVAGNRADLPRPIVALADISKAFGPTLANAEIDLTVSAGTVIGLVGGNGAGKSTLMRVLCGAVAPTLGTIAFDGETFPFSIYDTGEAQRRGIRMVHQELSICTNLSVAENFYLEAPDDGSIRPGWRNTYRSRARRALDVVFPSSRIPVDEPVGRLTIGERQMVEIARAAATPGVRLIILDEPTSSLDAERSRQLRAFVKARAAEGLAFIFISHKLQEVVDIATDVVVLRNGRLVQLMGGDADAIHHHRIAKQAGEPLLTVGGRFAAPLDGEIRIGRGEIVGLAGLEGSGQKELLHALFDPHHARSGEVRRAGEVSFIAGDRQKEGVFPLWSVLENISIGRLARRAGLGFVSDAAERAAARSPAAALRLDQSRFESSILELSGGNQQKALVARALTADAQLILLDDPTRGVDIATKQDFYRLCNEIAAAGRTLVWYTTEDAELLATDRVLVFQSGQVVAELTGKNIRQDRIVQASFSRSAEAAGGGTAGAGSGRIARRLVDLAPVIGLALVVTIMTWVNPLVASVFGADLLLMPALSLVLVTVAQMFIVGGSEIDLGVGAFAGLVSVLAATLLYDRPLTGAAAIVAVLLAYTLLGGLIQARRIPAIVVTLGASFIWVGLGYALQPTPGGASPEWLSALVGWSVSDLPTSILLIVAVALIARAIDWSPIGVALRGFGNNAAAMRRSGWSPTRYALVRYFIAGLFAAAAGLSLTAINTASDINSGNSYTLLSIAAVVMGGCTLIGGIISPFGAVVGAVTLGLIGALLGTLGVSSDYNPATQGLVLIGLLALRSAVAERSAED